jgi:butyrate kinase
MEQIIIAIDTGSTTTKIGTFSGLKCLSKTTISHPMDVLLKYPSINAQKEYRLEAILQWLNALSIKKIDAVVGRGGVLAPIKSGAYIVNELMLDRLINRSLGEHASNLGAQLAYEISAIYNVIAYIYDGVTVDEIDDVARITGYINIRRTCRCHMLNMKAVAMHIADKNKISYKDSTFIVTHVGSGITSSLHKKGRVVDVVLDSEGPFSAERPGKLPSTLLVRYMMNNQIDPKEMYNQMRREFGISSYFGTNSIIKVIDMVNCGNTQARLVIDAMAYQIGKSIGELAAAASGYIDYIVLTGAVSYNTTITDYIINMVKFIAPIEIVPGEYELEAMAHGIYRVLIGTEKPHEYDMNTDDLPINFV